MPHTPHPACRPIFLMSPPTRAWHLKGRANFRSASASEVDASRARAEWSALADAIVEAGGEVVVMPPEDDTLTGLIYTAESGELFRDEQGDLRFLLPTMASPHRRPEAELIERFIHDTFGLQIHRVQHTWEAQGDAIRAAHGDQIVHTYGEGPYQRTTQAAYAEVAPRLSPQHIQIGFKADPWFHGNTFLQFFRRRTDTIGLVCPDALLDGELDRLQAFLGPEIELITISPEESRGYDTNALQVCDTVIAPTSFSPTARRATDALDLQVKTLPLDELFAKGGGAPVCLTNRLWGLDIAEVPDEVRWSLQPSIEAHTTL
ncbi:hypothetical protein EA187_08335 [Lujinxingia sediminis]|uniref:Amidinotransferase n=1 Tax=Lujinxingia sediminis TaxID=2480984 RepID=A0ABY0CU16_9DELT|nr:hypothetical protein [Lujinxingia sediminis]RVU45762.1 hypothetical protein EA187_08335 [Lujinxingia sediminis]